MEVSPTRIAELDALARQVRRLVLESVHEAKGGHIGGPLSAADMLVALYFDVLRLRPDEPEWADRDRFVLSKGHSAIALYATLALRGFFPVEELGTFDKIDSRLQGHPDMTVTPGIDMSTGSLGQGISSAAGMALGARLTGRPFRVFAMVGDGECQEGQVWEAAMMAARYALGNFTVILDDNRMQQFGWQSEDHAMRAPVEAPAEIWSAFGWHVQEIDGHDVEAFLGAVGAADAQTDRPSVIVAHTVKGKGVSFMERDFSWHSRVPTDEELARAVAELEAGPSVRGGDAV